MSIGKLVSHGSAPYKDDPNNSKSYFVELENNGKTQKIWGIDLENAMEKTSANIGDMVTVNNLGSQTVNIPDPDDPSKTKSVKKNNWEIETYEPYQKLENAIEHDAEREQEKLQLNTAKDLETEKSEKSEKSIPNLSEFEGNLPDSIKYNYVGIAKNRFLQDEKINYYDKSDADQVNIAFEDRKNSLNTSRQDEKTINAMMDLAESKGWTAIKLKGTEEFKQKAWLEASLRGIETKGYTPSEKDKAELIAKQEARTINHVEATAIKEPSLKTEHPSNDNNKQEEKGEEKNKGLLSKFYTKEADKTTKDHVKDVGISVATTAGLAMATGGSVTAGTVAKAVVMDKVQNYAMDKTLEAKESKEKVDAKIIRNEIKDKVQNGYRDGTISNRDDLVAHLKKEGYEVVRENEKSIRLKIPNSEQHLTLKGDMFVKDFDALKEMKSKLEPDAIKERYSNISDTDIAKITLWKEHLLDKYESPKVQQEMLVKLESNIKDIANGKDLMGMPSIPANETQPDIDVRTPDNAEPSRQR